VNAPAMKIQSSSRRAIIAWRLLRNVLGIFLVGASALKAHALWIDPTPPIGLFSSPGWVILTIEVESLLGLWLLSGLYPGGAWLSTLVGFALLAGASLYVAVAGRPSCGCLGKLQINPWYTLAFDGLAFVALSLNRPLPPSSGSLGLGSGFVANRRAALAGVGAAAFLVVAFVGLTYVDSSVSNLMALLRDEPLTIEPPLTEMGDAMPGEDRLFQIQVVNHSDKPIRLIGGTADCACVTTVNLPTTIGPQERRSLTIEYRFGPQRGAFQKVFVLFTDDRLQPRVMGRVTGRLLEVPIP
jgi:hypothetical protein